MEMIRELHCGSSTSASGPPDPPFCDNLVNGRREIRPAGALEYIHLKPLQ